ncbi:MAG TPA: hypothetical protein ENH97_03075 [bacterium]|nr:hypothetical protein [bacterium]
MIESYSFGSMVIDGKEYTSDLIIYPDHTQDSWWRKEGHRLDIEDIKEILEAKPEVLVVGTGASGLVEIPEETEKHIRSKGIRLIVQKSEEAYKTFNALSKSKKVIGAFHLTC